MKKIAFKINKILLLIACGVLLLSGCSKSEKTEDSYSDSGWVSNVTGQDDFTPFLGEGGVWTIIRRDRIESPEGEIWNSTQYYDGAEYYTTHTWNKVDGFSAYSLMRRTEESAECLLTLEKGIFTELIHIDGDGYLYLLNEIPDEEKVHFELLKVDQQGTVIYRKMAPMAEEYMEYIRIAEVVDSEDGLCALTNTAALLFWDDQGNETAQISLDLLDDENSYGGYDLVHGSEGIYVCHSEYKSQILDHREILCCFHLVDIGTATLSEESNMEIMLGDDEKFVLHDTSGLLKFYSDPGHGFFMSDSFMLYYYDDAAKEIKEVLNWSNPYVAFERAMAYMITSAEPGRLLISVDDSGTGPWFNYWFIRVTEEEAKREEITIGEFSLNGSQDQKLLKCAQEFNVSQGKYLVSLKEYDIENMTAFDLDLLQGNGPDLICLDKLDKRKYMSNGVLEDIAPYLAESEELNANMLLPSILDAITEEGQIHFVFPTFAIQVLMIQEEYAGEEVMTTGEFLQMGTLGDEKYLAPENTYSLFQKMLLMDKDQYLDWKEGKCLFNDGRFVKLLEQVHDSDVPRQSSLLSLQQFCNGMYLAKFETLNDLYDYLYYRGIVEHTARIIGYPNEQREILYPIISKGALGLNSASKQKAGAWTFLEFYMHHYGDQEESQNNFRTLEKDFEKQLIRNANVGRGMKNIFWDEEIRIVAMGDDTEVYIDPSSGDVIEFIVRTEEKDLEMVRYMVDHAYLIDEMLDAELETMLVEEVLSYLGNGKSAEEVAEVIQRKVSLYMSEQVW